MSFKIGETRYIPGKDNNEIFVLTPDDMTRESYSRVYRGRLFCPYPNCSARLSFVSFTAPPIRYFRTWQKDEHLSECPYGVEYQEVVGTRRAFNPDYAYGLSDQHVDAVLRRAHLALLGRVHAKYGENRSKKSASHAQIDETLDPDGVAALLGDSLDLSNGREPKVYIRSTDNLTTSDDGQVRCVIGIATFMWLDDRYGYLNLQSTDTQIKIHFNEAFIATNEAEYRNFHFIKRYVTENKNKPVCCIGRVSKTSTGFDIRPDRWNGFSVNTKKLYEIVNDYLNLDI